MKNSNKRGTILLVTGFLSCLALSVQAKTAREVSFDMPSLSTVETGYVRLEWSRAVSEEEVSIPWYELQQSSHEDFSDPVHIYHGPDRASFVSGLSEGKHYFRVRLNVKDENIKGAWSESAVVQVKYQSMALAWTLFGTGSAVFLCTAMVILFGTRKFSREN